MKKINKSTFDDLLRVQRKYRRTGDVDILDKKHNLCNKLHRDTGIYWVVFDNLTSAFAELNTTNEQANKVMNLLGFELDDEILGEENE